MQGIVILAMYLGFGVLIKFNPFALHIVCAVFYPIASRGKALKWCTKHFQEPMGSRQAPSQVIHSQAWSPQYTRFCWARCWLLYLSKRCLWSGISSLCRCMCMWCVTRQLFELLMRSWHWLCRQLLGLEEQLPIVASSTVAAPVQVPVPGHPAAPSSSSQPKGEEATSSFWSQQ